VIGWWFSGAEVTLIGAVLRTTIFFIVRFGCAFLVFFTIVGY
jgi:hypothetical protein